MCFIAFDPKDLTAGIIFHLSDDLAAIFRRLSDIQVICHLRDTEIGIAVSRSGSFFLIVFLLVHIFRCYIDWRGNHDSCSRCQSHIGIIRFSFCLCLLHAIYGNRLYFFCFRHL